MQEAMRLIRWMFFVNRARLIHAGVALIFAFCATEQSYARTWNVFVDGSGDAPTVQAGIDSSASEDTVLVHPGTYTELINFGAKNIVLRSQSGPVGTILDGTGFGSAVVTINQGQDRTAKVEGFTITHGKEGVFILDAGPSVIGNVITDNAGGGVSCNASANSTWFPLIQDNTITNNMFSSNGGGITTQPGVVPEILDNRISANHAEDGGGIYCLLGASGAVIRGNRLGDNQAFNDGGGIYVQGVSTSIDVEISWNLVRGNWAGGADFCGDGCGIDLVGTQAWVHHNTIVGNDGDGVQTRCVFGGGIAVNQAGSPTIEQNVIAFNTPGSYFGLGAGGGIGCATGTTPIIRNNFSWQNDGGDVLGDCAASWQSNGNVTDNPYFCDSAAGDYTVASNSGVMTHPAGPLGAFSTPGCGPVDVQHTTWGSLKAKY
jgi:copper-binding protein NosD